MEGCQSSWSAGGHYFRITSYAQVNNSATTLIALSVSINKAHPCFERALKRVNAHGRPLIVGKVLIKEMDFRRCQLFRFDHTSQKQSIHYCNAFLLRTVGPIVAVKLVRCNKDPFVGDHTFEMTKRFQWGFRTFWQRSQASVGLRVKDDISQWYAPGTLLLCHVVEETWMRLWPIQRLTVASRWTSLNLSFPSNLAEIHQPRKNGRPTVALRKDSCCISLAQL